MKLQPRSALPVDNDLLRLTHRQAQTSADTDGIAIAEHTEQWSYWGTGMGYRIAERRLNWFEHVSRMGSERLPAKALHCSYINGKRNQGRQPKKWIENLNEDIEAKKLTVQQAMVLVWDRNKWKHHVAASSSLK